MNGLVEVDIQTMGLRPISNLVVFPAGVRNVHLDIGLVQRLAPLPHKRTGEQASAHV